MRRSSKSAKKKLRLPVSRTAGSYFFQDSEAIDFLKDSILPLFLRRRPNKPLLRVWVPQFSSSEDVFSLAICLLEFLDKWASTLSVQIFATHSDEQIVKATRAGMFPSSIAATVSPQRLKKFFEKLDNGYRIRKPVRDMCVFATHDLIGDPPFSRIDLIDGRNAMKVMRPSLQNRAVSLFHFAVIPEGFVLMDSGKKRDIQHVLFSRAHKGQNVFRKNPLDSHGSFNFTLRRHAVQAFHALSNAAKNDRGSKNGNRGKSAVRNELDHLRIHLQAMFEEQEQVNEQLQTSNEEIVSNNEELHAANEELETTREELRVANEQLISALEELRSRIGQNQELNSELNSEQNSILSAIDMSIVLLDGDLRIRRYSLHAQRLLNLIPTDIGRPITDLRTRIVLPDLAPIVSGVIETLSVREIEVRDDENCAYRVRICPCRSRNNRVEGVVLAISELDRHSPVPVSCT